MQQKTAISNQTVGKAVNFLGGKNYGQFARRTAGLSGALAGGAIGSIGGAAAGYSQGGLSGAVTGGLAGGAAGTALGAGGGAMRGHLSAKADPQAWGRARRDWNSLGQTLKTSSSIEEQAIQHVFARYGLDKLAANPGEFVPGARGYRGIRPARAEQSNLGKYLAGLMSLGAGAGGVHQAVKHAPSAASVSSAMDPKNLQFFETRAMRDQLAKQRIEDRFRRTGVGDSSFAGPAQASKDPNATRNLSYDKGVAIRRRRWDEEASKRGQGASQHGMIQEQLKRRENPNYPTALLPAYGATRHPTEFVPNPIHPAYQSLLHQSGADRGLPRTYTTRPAAYYAQEAPGDARQVLQDLQGRTFGSRYRQMRADDPVGSRFFNASFDRRLDQFGNIAGQAVPRPVPQNAPVMTPLQMTPIR